MNKINRYLRNLRPYKVASHKIWSVDPNERKKVLKLDWNEATYQASPNVLNRLRNLLENDCLNYYPSTYNAELYEKLSSYVGLPKENIQYFASSDSLHEYIAKMFISVGDPILIVWPSYDNFRLTAEVSGANVFYFNLNDDFSFDYEKFEKTINEKSPSLIYICNPNNPTGFVLNKRYIEKLLIEYPDIMFLIDEAYIEFCPENTTSSLVRKYENIFQ